MSSGTKVFWVLPLIVISQFFCTSLWFAGNVVMPELAGEALMTESMIGHITSAVQFGFIVGTLSYALLNIPDLFSPSKVFFTSAVAAALANLGMLLNDPGIYYLLLMRFLTGFFLAGIYPVGMRIAADYYGKGLGKALGFLVGALVLGTAFPHLLKSFTSAFLWKMIALLTSALALTGGLLIWLFVPDGPFRKTSQKLDLTASLKVFRNNAFRSASFGYFGHMWELYTLWAFIPLMLVTYLHTSPDISFPVSPLSFVIIGLGGISCVVSGYISLKAGSRNTAFTFLLLSCLCCLLSPLAFQLPPLFFIAFLLFWGFVVVADSPMFSTLVAQNAPAESKGTALTVVNCIGFSITIISIELIGFLMELSGSRFTFMLLAVGPVLGLIALIRPSERKA